MKKAIGLIITALLLLVFSPGMVKTAQAGTVTIPTGDYTITEDGIYQLDSGYSGVITIANTVHAVTVSDEVYKASHNNTSIVIEGWRTASLELTIEDINITASNNDRPGIDFGSANNYENKLYISGTCSVTGGLYRPGIWVLNNGGQLIIDKALNEEDAQLTATGGFYGAGIGGGYYSGGGTITINGGTVTATGGTYGAGIGGGNFGVGGTITVNGGTITATGGNSGGAGIGGGYGKEGGTVTVNGGTVTANGGQNGAGIGGGYIKAGGTITINGGTVTANGGQNGAGIGGGAFGGAGGNVIITGTPIVYATGDTASGAEDIGRGKAGADSGTLKNDSGADLSYLRFSTAGVPGANIRLTGANDEYMTNDQGICGIFVPRSGSVTYTVSKAGYAAAQGTQALSSVSYGINITMEADNTPPDISDAAPLVLSKGTPVAVTCNNYGIYGILYLVPKAGAAYTSKAALDGAAGKKTAVIESPATTGSIDTTDLAEGIYQVYLADSAENVSLPSADITVDNTLPWIESASRAADDTYIDLDFSEGIYGAADGVSGLTKDKLQLVFAANGGTAAGAEITAVKKNDGTQADPEGGETTVRVFIAVTGLPCGVETIEIKPADGGSIYDKIGNAMDGAQTTGAVLLEDRQAPAVGNGAISTANITQTGATLSWEKASDLATAQAELQYCIYRSAADNLNTVSDIEANGTVQKDYTADIGTFDVTGLQPGSTYYFNVIVRDNAGNKTCYNKVSVTTNATSSSSGDHGGSTDASQLADSTTGSATVSPAVGGAVGLGSDVSVKIPANALQGNVSAQVAVQKADTPPPAPSGFMILGTVYQFTVNDQDHYSFNKPVTLTFTFDPSSLVPGETPAVYYYDENKGQWVNIGGTVSGNTITVTVDHFTEYAVLAAEKAARPQEQKPSAPLTDISGHWAEANINKLVSLGAISGYPDGTFRPDSTITRAEFATVLVKAFQLAPKEGRVFDDTANSWAKDYISTAAACRIVGGYDENTFGPDEPVTREQMAVMTVKAAKLSPANEQISFGDSADISAWAKEAVATVVKVGIIKGYPDNTFRPGADATRAEAATIVVNALNK